MGDISMNAAILETAGKYLGVKEFPGAATNPVIAKFWKDAGINITNDAEPWCAGFVGGVLGELGIPGTGKATARSYLNWGRKIAYRDIMPGDVVIFWRESPSSWKGHVGVLLSVEGDKVLIRGGNQDDMVKDSYFPVHQILGIRRADRSLPSTGYGTKQIGNSAPDAEVMVLQTMLREVGYPLGKLDGIFGQETRKAVLAFQADHGLEPDGIVGQKTWNKLIGAERKPTRDVSEADLRKAKSTTINNADRAMAGGATTAVIGAGTVISRIDETVTQVEYAGNIVERASVLLSNNLVPIILIGLGLYIAWKNRAIIIERVRQAVSGENLSK